MLNDNILFLHFSPPNHYTFTVPTSKGEMMKSFVEDLQPIFKSDLEEWEEIKARLKDIPSIFWYGGAGFDLKPVRAFQDASLPSKVKELTSTNSFAVLTDYNSELAKIFPKIYDRFDEEEFSLKKIGHYAFKNANSVEILQMVPLKLFDSERVKLLRKQYEKNRNPHIADFVIPDKKWHFIYFVVEMDGREYDFLYGLIENLVFFKEVVQRYDLNIEIFCALRVGGKSGSWESIYNIKSSKLVSEIAFSKTGRPKVWITDTCYEIEKVWQRLDDEEECRYGKMSFFKADWEKYSTIRGGI
jgi:hypothetical protein